MTTKKLLRLGLIGSCVMLLASAGVLLWPLIGKVRFWLTASFVVGIIGTFFFTVALASVEGIDDKGLIYEEE